MTEVKNYNGRPTIMIDGRPLAPSLMTVRTRSNETDDIFFDPEYFAALGKSGMKIFLLHCNTLWIQPNSVELFEKEAKMLLEAVPDAYIIPRIGLHPPAWWVEQHPEECCQYDDGSSPPTYYFTESYETTLPHAYSLCSSKWREDAGKELQKVWKRLMDLPFSHRIIGCFPAAGKTSEWLYGRPTMLPDQKMCLDHSEAFRREFSDYLRRTYKTDENLQKHWKDPNVTIDNPTIPTFDQRFFVQKLDESVAKPEKAIRSFDPIPIPRGNEHHYGSFCDLDKSRQVYDFYRAWHEGTARSQIHFANCVKEVTPDRIVGFCHGAQAANNYITSGTAGGIRLMLESKNVDFMLNPSVYENRLPGGCVGQRVAFDSFSLHNKIYISQEDSRTSMENRHHKRLCGVFDMEDTINTMKREFGKNICEDIQNWWFDQIPGGNRFRDPAIYDLFKQQAAIAQEAYSLDRTKKSEIALIYDDESLQTISLQSSQEMVEQLRNYELPRVGAQMDQYSHNDMADPNMPSYKLYIFVNTMVLTEEERQVIRAKLKKDGAVAVWVYAPGFIDPNADKKMSVETMRDLTGMEFTVIKEKFDAMFRWDGEKHPLSQDMDRREFFGHNHVRRIITNGNGIGVPATTWRTYLYPLFYVSDPDAKHLAYFQSERYPAVSIKEDDGFTSVYYGAKILRHDVIRAFAKYAGVHINSDSGDVCYVGRNYITFHASKSGTKTLRFPEKVSLFEVYEKKCYGADTDSVTFQIGFGETKMFRIDR